MDKLTLIRFVMISLFIGGLLFSGQDGDETIPVAGARAATYGQIDMRPGAGIEMNPTTPGDIETWGGNVNNATHVNSTYISIIPAQLNAIVYWDGTNAIARYENGSLISSGTDNDTVIQAAHDAIYATGGGVLHFKDYFTGTDTTIEQQGAVEFIGEGDSSSDLTGIEGTANPIINITRENGYGKIYPLTRMRIRTTGASNDGVATVVGTDMAIRDCQFRTDGSSGAMFNATWWSVSLLEKCTFRQEDEDRTGTAVKLWGSGTDYAIMTSIIQSCYFSYFEKGVSITTDEKDYIASINVVECWASYCSYGVFINGTGSVDIHDGCFDSVTVQGVHIENANCVNVHDMYIGCTAAAARGIYVNASNGDCRNIWIHDNEFISYGSVGTSYCIDIYSNVTSKRVINGWIHHNQISGWAGGIRLWHTLSGASDYHTGFQIDGNRFESVSYRSIACQRLSESIIIGNNAYGSEDADYATVVNVTAVHNIGISDN